MSSPELRVWRWACAAAVLSGVIGNVHALESDGEIEDLLRNRIEVSKRGVGMVVGIADERGRRVIAYGKRDKSGDEAVNADTVFEIGSVTKVFTALLLADMANRGEVKLDDAISKYLPKTVRTPRVDGQEITLLHLARHTSGLPSVPTRFAPKDPANPYANFKIGDLYAFLAEYRTSRLMGRHYEYSNLGFRLLGHILELRAACTYEELIRARVLDPLDMKSTGVVASADMRERLASGHSRRNNSVSSWDFPELQGSGSLRSTANDLLNFVEANLGLRDSPLQAAMKAIQATNADKLLPDLELGLGWQQSTLAGNRIVWHSGMTGGYTAFVGLDPGRRRGVVMLSNSAIDITNIGFHLLDNSVPVSEPESLKDFTATRIAAQLFDPHAGKYQLEPTGAVVTLRREGDRFFVTTEGGRKRELLAESPTRFFTADMEEWFDFTRDRNGRPGKATWHQDAGWRGEMRRLR